MIKIFPIIFVCIILLTHPGMAQDAAEMTELEFFKLEDNIVFTATKTKQKLSDAPASMYVITREDIEKYGYTSLEQALARIPEVFTHFNGHNYSSDFRGFFANNIERRVLYLINGHKINDRFHFGDQYPDIISDLSNVEKIEVIRGPGAALYGNNSVLEVVNIITKKAAETRATKILVEGSNLNTGSYTQKYQVIHNKQYTEDLSIMADIYWFQGAIDYETNTSWTSPQGSNGRINYSVKTDAYFTADNSTGTGAFETGTPLPNGHILISWADISLGAFLYSKAVTWSWPNSNFTFNHDRNDRQWSTGSLYIKYEPEKNILGKLDFKASVSYNIHTNREVAVWLESHEGSAMTRIDQAFNRDAYIKDSSGSLYNYPQTVYSGMSNAVINANGGGVQFIYHGIDRTAAFDFQATPLKLGKDLLIIMLGANCDISDYENYQRFTYLNNQFIGWAGWGGISDNGYNIGTWTQFIYHPLAPLTITAGVRYDYQHITEVYRQLGGSQIYLSNDTSSAKRFENKSVYDITPRVAISWSLSEDHTIRALYGQAFRAVAAQEMVRLPDSITDEAKSEKTHNFELIYSGKFFERSLGISMNGFYLIGDQIYSWDKSIEGFSIGDGWYNIGGSLEISYFSQAGFELWANGTYYYLQKPVSSYLGKLGGSATDEYKNRMANETKPMDSPTLLIKGGGSYRYMKNSSIAIEALFNGGTEMIYVNSASTEFVDYTVPASVQLNIIVTHSFDFGLRLQAKVKNLLEQDEYAVLSPDSESGLASYYKKPHQLPEFGRTATVVVSYEF
ncbi:MAG: TonB-dependent receptor [bacterium]|nr:TonB-dependent receptor [bacterium]